MGYEGHSLAPVDPLGGLVDGPTFDLENPSMTFVTHP